MRRRAPRRHRRPRSCALVALSACGASGSPSGSPATPRRAAARPAARVAPEADRRASKARSTSTGGARLPAPALRRRAAGQDRGAARRPPARASPFLDISDLVSFEGERGLLSVAFPPDYASSGRFYVYYTDNDGNIRVDEFHRRSPIRAARGSRRERDRDPPPGQLQPQRRPAPVPRRPPLLRHRRRRLRRRPAEQRPEQGQSCSASCCGSTPGPSGGKPYSVPASNPFVGRPGRDEIYSYGLRNPFRFSFDTVSAGAPRIAIGDVGQNRIEEIDYTTVGRRRGRQLRLGRLRGLRPLHRRKQRHRRPRRDRQTDLRLPAQPRRQLLDHRRLRRRRPQPPRSLQALRLRRLLRGRAAQPRPPPEAGERRPQARARGRQPELLRRRRSRHVSTSPRSTGPVYRLVPR